MNLRAEIDESISTALTSEKADGYPNSTVLIKQHLKRSAFLDVIGTRRR